MVSSRQRSSHNLGPRVRKAPDLAFDPERHREPLLGALREIERLEGARLEGVRLTAILRRYPREGRGFFSRSQLIAGVRHFAESGELRGDAAAFVARLQRRPVRTQSGVTPITVLTKPFPCPGRCVFCPSDVRMPKSYLADEPGAQRAAVNKFDPYLQTWNRLAALAAIGHPTEKVELIVLGGTWSFYPERYQVWFALRLFQAMNDFGAGRDGRADAAQGVPDFESLPARNPATVPGPTYNQRISRFLAAGQGGDLLAVDESADWEVLAAAQRENESSLCRSVGFSVETRPDHVDAEEVLRIRRLGCTKVQLGVQSLDDDILLRNQRGHDCQATRQAFALLRAAGFKIQVHWMPNLLGATPETDAKGFEQLFADPAFRPDELKLYPCSLIESAELMRFYESGEWRPYDYDALLSVVTSALAATPRYCRATRVIRDISSDDIVAGNKRTNFRELAEKELLRLGQQSCEIRSREIRGESFDDAALRLVVTEYVAGGGHELFLEWVTEADRLTAFLRLHLPSAPPASARVSAPVPELEGRALLREVHVYGASLELGERSSEGAQHRGLGRSLVEEACRLARERGYRELSVISAVGTRPYYRLLGFVDGELYQHRRL